jgi:TPR repeat protein
LIAGRRAGAEKVRLSFAPQRTRVNTMNRLHTQRPGFWGLAVGMLLCLNPMVMGQESLAELTAAAKKNNVEAQYKLGRAYELGLGTPASPKDAMEWYRRAARANHAPAQLALGCIYAAGAGTKQDWREAARNFQAAAEAGLPEAQCRLAFCLARGLGVKANPAEAARFYEKAAEKGVLEAQMQLGEMYYNGEGVEKDYRMAFKWLLRAAERGLPEAQYRVGGFYLLGQGDVKRDLVEAHKWFILALPLGRDDAHKLPEKMATLYRMTPEQIQESYKRAKEFKPAA